MTRTASGSVLKEWEQLQSGSGIAVLFVTFLFITGCITTGGQSRKPGADTPTQPEVVEQQPMVKQEQAVIQVQAQQIAQLESREKELEKELRLMGSKLKAGTVARESLTRRLEITQAAREEAIREVVRIRARIQGMASQAEASAMFAEARVILDRMENEAFNKEALAELDLARSYMARGKGALDNGNPGGAAYLFDQIPGVYEVMKKAEPRTIRVNVSIAALRKSPTPSSPKISSLYWGESTTGLEKKKDWIKVKISSGQSGWIRKDQAQ
jgi:hypothetical protein